MLRTEGLNAFYGRAHILHDLALSVGRGEVVVLLGRNGAGKSTTLKSLTRLVEPRSGRTWFHDRRIDGLKPYQIARLGLGYVPEERRIFTDLTVEENLEVGRQKPRDGLTPWTRERVFSFFPSLEEMRKRRASRMSGGEQQMLTIARTLMGNPSCILLDEPSEGLAPMIVELMASTIRELKAEGLSVLLSEQNLNFAMAVADRAYIIEKGQIRFAGTVDELKANEGIRKAYLAV
jgi:branched-chain amino acid transport system ATP-binding protein